jgi:hypothetical protein
MAYVMHRVFCSTPGNLEAERQAFEEVVGQVNAAEAMAKGILFVPVSIVANVVNKMPFQSAIEANVQACKFFVQVLQDTWGTPERNFESEYKLACRLKADSSSLMEEVSLFFKAADGLPVEPGILQLKSSVESQQDSPAYGFASLEEYKQQLLGQFSEWLQGVTSSAAS